MHRLDPSIPILLVDDDIVDIMDMKRMFKKNKIDNPLHIATNGVEALAMLREKTNTRHAISRECIILLDLNMPKMNGIEFLKILRADPDLCSIVVFVLTTSNADQDKIAVHDLNISGYFVKPIQFSSLEKNL